MAGEFNRDYLVRLPLPLAQLYSRAHNAKDGRSRHDNTFYLFEALVKLSAAPLVAAYVSEVQHGSPRDLGLDHLLAQLALPSLGQWVGMVRELARHFGQRPDAATHPLGHLWEQLNLPRRDLSAFLALYRRIKNGPDGQAGGDQSASLLQLFEALVQYRNGVFGHGGPRFESFYSQEMGPLLFPAANEVLAEGVHDLLGPRGSRLVYLTEVRTVDQDRVEVGLRELVGREGERLAPLNLTTAQAASLLPNRVAVLWPGRPVPLRLDPLLQYRESETAEEILFLNRDRNGRQVEYLSYTTGRTERDRNTAAALAALLSQVINRQVTEDDLQALAEHSRAETSSLEALFGAALPAVRQLGDYEVLAEIGRGGMGVVYLARQLSLGRLVALKMLPADLAGDEVALARFRREIRHLARCEHPNIVKVLSSGTLPDGQLYYTMEYVPGCDLEAVWRELAKPGEAGSTSTLGQSTWVQAVLTASRKRREHTSSQTSQGSASGLANVPAETPVAALPLPPLPELPSAADDPGGYVRRVVQLVRDAALALQAVHDQHIIHRDVKPANLVLTPDGARMVLMDFGLAKGQSLALTVSQGGGFLGTWRYAAPEQLAAATLKIGPAADIRGLGVVLWELLTRRRLFAAAEDEKQLATLIFDRDVPLLRTVDAGLDRDLEAIVARATERRAADRIQTAGLLAEYLHLYLEGKPLPIRPPSTAEMVRRWLRQHKGLVSSAAAAVLAVVVTILIAFGLISASKDEAVDARNKALQLLDEKGRLVLTEREERQQAQRRLAALDLERGLVLCEQGESGQGILWLARSLKDAPEGDAELHRSIRMFLAGWSRQLHPLRAILPQAAEVTSVAFSPNGLWVVTGTDNGTVQQWEAATGRAFGPAMRHQERIESVAYSPDNLLILTTSYDHTGQLWEAATGKALGAPLRHNDNVTQGLFSPDGRTVLTACVDGTARLWEVPSGQQREPILEHGKWVNVIGFSPDGQTILTCSYGEVAQLWKTVTGKPLGTPLFEGEFVNAATFSPDGKLVLTAYSSDPNARLWDTASGQLREPVLPHQKDVLTVAFSPDGKTIITGSEDHTAQLWETATGKPQGPPLKLPDFVREAAFRSDGKVVLTNSLDAARLWEAATGRLIGSPLRHGGVVRYALFSPDGNLVLTTSEDKTTRLWGVITGQATGPVLRQERGIVALAFSPDGRMVATCGNNFDSTVRLWDSGTRKAVGTPLKHDLGITALAFSPDGKTIVTACQDHQVRLWELASGKVLGEPFQHDQYVSAVAFSPDGKTIAMGSYDKTVQLWDPATNKVLGAPLHHKESVYAVAFSPDGKILLTGSGDKTAQLWDVATRQAMGGPLSHQGPVLAVVFSPDGKMILTGSDDRTAQLWETATGKAMGPALNHQAEVKAVAFSPDGHFVLTGSKDSTARLWETVTGKPLGPALLHPEEVSAVAFRPDGQEIVTGCQDGLARFWPVPAALPGQIQQIDNWTQVMTGMTLDEAGLIHSLDFPAWQERRLELEKLGGPPVGEERDQ